ncbi:TetR family transcriptional regulator [Novosphingobium arvoryzae]|uniref:TetR family transcriptional regulator n=1 Tax=Novosphingobium arvoryzae TaxID=1256514 RepID=A0A918RN91_9SPHN|nr:TetR family transcriptional regulator [Novosphingobium arvoryzae]GHA05129.1 TetR family transcriptional regulator [Novosphingobium arvoryzae]
MTAPAQTKSRPAPRPRPDAYNHYGQKIGSKGERTRQLLIDVTVDLLETHGLRDVSVVDVARAANTSPATFYVYFRGVPEVVLAALETASQTSPELEALLGQDWLAPGAAQHALPFVEAYTALWNRHRTIFRVRNLAAEEGDDRFYKARMQAATPMMGALTEQIARAQAAGLAPSDLSARACAGTILMMLERLAAIGPITHEDQGIGYAALKSAAAYTVAFMLGARG